METTFVQIWNSFVTTLEQLRQDGGDPNGASHAKASLGKMKTCGSANTTRSSEMTAALLFNHCSLIPNPPMEKTWTALGEKFWTTLEQLLTTGRQLLYNFGTTLEQLVDKFWTNFGQLWNNLETTLGYH